jgi:hypothetical protein
MWNYSKEDLVKETKVVDFLEKSGCYEMTIESVEDKKTTNGADQVVFKFVTDSGAKVNIFYIYSNLKGEPIDWKVSKLNQLCGLLKVAPEKIADMKGKTVGVFLKANGTSRDGKYINWDIDGFYDVKTKGTTKELEEKVSVADSYAKFEEKYAKEEPIVTNYTSGGGATTESKPAEDINEDFPF